MSRQLAPIPALSRDTAIYIAGLVDGEGCFFICRQKKGTGMCYSPQFKITLTHEDTITWLADKLNCTYIHKKGNEEKNHKDVYEVRLASIDVIISFIEQVLPFMITKKIVASTLMNYCISRKDNWPKGNRERGYSTEQIELCDAIRDLNQVGINKLT